MTDKVRVGVIGTSGYTGYMHLANIKSHHQAVLAAICGRNLERAGELAAGYEIPNVFGDYRAMIESGGLDAVVVSTPDDLHHPITMLALEAGLHVLCEKPLAMNAHQARQMLDAAEARGLVHMVMFEWRAIPEYRQMVDMLQNGQLGKINHLAVRWLGGFARSPAYIWRVDAAHGNGALGDLGSHMIDLARLMIGEITRVSAHLSCSYPHTREDGQLFEPANDTAVVLLEFASGAHAVMQFSNTTHFPEGGVEHLVSGTEGTLKSVAVSPGEGLWLARSADKSFQKVALEERFTAGCDPAVSMLDRFLDIAKRESIGSRRFIDAVLGKEKVESSFHDGWKAQLVIDAAIESHLRKVIVAIESEQYPKSKEGI
jgi:predicted dehydrogenase